MIIDTHVHIGRVLNFNMKKEHVLYSMERYGIDYSIVSDCRGTESDHHQRVLPFILQTPQIKCIQETIDFAKAYPDKIGAALWLRPMHETADDKVYRIIEENREYVKALKFHPFHSAVNFDADKMEPFMELAKHFDLPVVVHTGGADHASCKRVYNMAQRHPDINFVMVHMGLGTDNTEAEKLIGMLPNLYGDTTWVSMKNTIRFIENNGDDKILFGSDNPIDGKDTYLHNKYGDRSIYQDYFHVLPDLIPKDSYEKLMWKNAVKLFSLENICKE